MAKNENRAYALFKRLPLRVRITLWVVGIFAAIHITLGLVYLLYQRSASESFFDARLELRANHLSDALAPELEGVSDQRLLEIAERQLGLSTIELFLAAVLREDGAVVAATRRPFPNLDHVIDMKGSLASSETVRVPSLFEPNDSRAPESRVATRPIGIVEGRRHYLLLAINENFAQPLRTFFGRVLLFAVPVGLITAVICGWIVGGVAVAPLESLRQVARRLTPESIRERIEMSGSSPEVAQLREEIEQARSRMETAFAAQARFMSNVSHELKTPVAVLMTEAQTIRAEGLPEDAKSFVRLVQEEMRRLGRMIDSFLTLTRVQDGKSTTISRRVPVNDLITESVIHCASMAKQYMVRIDTQLLQDDDDLDLAVRGDPDLLRTMIDNLIRNAIRFSPSEGVVRVCATRVAEGVAIAVRDFGAGIPADVLPRIFDRFAQAPSEERRGRGHGLGLEIAQGIAELHAGQITARNCEVGCEFTVWIPLESGWGARARRNRQMPQS